MELKDRLFIHHGNDFIDKNLSYHNDKLTEKTIKEVQESPYMQKIHNKSLYGLWTCTYKPNKKYKSDWEKFAHSSKLRNKNELSNFCIFEVKEDSKILELNSKRDIINLDPKYAYVKISTEKKELGQELMSTEITSPKYFYLLQKYYKEKDIILLNAKEIAKDFDALYLSDEVISEARDSFSLWDVETLLIFNLDIIKEVNTMANSSSN